MILANDFEMTGSSLCPREHRFSMRVAFLKRAPYMRFNRVIFARFYLMMPHLDKRVV